MTTADLTVDSLGDILVANDLLTVSDLTDMIGDNHSAPLTFTTLRMIFANSGLFGRLCLTPSGSMTFATADPGPDTSCVDHGLTACRGCF